MKAVVVQELSHDRQRTETGTVLDSEYPEHRRKGSKFKSLELYAQECQDTNAVMLETLLCRVEMTVDLQQDSFNKIYLVIQASEVL